jgi:hypothetical protein
MASSPISEESYIMTEVDYEPKNIFLTGGAGELMHCVCGQCCAQYNQSSDDWWPKIQLQQCKPVFFLNISNCATSFPHSLFNPSTPF